MLFLVNQFKELINVNKLKIINKCSKYLTFYEQANFIVFFCEHFTSKNKKKT